MIIWSPDSNYILITIFSLLLSHLSSCALSSISLFSSLSFSLALFLPPSFSPFLLLSLSQICFSCNIIVIPSWGWTYILRTSPNKKKKKGEFLSASVRKIPGTCLGNRSSLPWAQWPGIGIMVDPAWVRCQPQWPHQNQGTRSLKGGVFLINLIELSSPLIALFFLFYQSLQNSSFLVKAGPHIL